MSHLGPAVKRLHKEYREIKEINASSEPLPFCVIPHPDSFLIWHFTLQGPSDSVYSDGLFHGKIEFPQDYPFSPPSLFFLTPNGRFEINVKICLTVTGFHPEQWQPAWSTRTMLYALRNHFLVEDKGALGYLGFPGEMRQELSTKSKSFKCSDCGYNMEEKPENLQVAGQETTVSSPPNRIENLYLFIISCVVLLLGLAAYKFAL
jgi:ubiquitin-conjugating enzyme E2 J1